MVAMVLVLVLVIVSVAMPMLVIVVAIVFHMQYLPFEDDIVDTLEKYALLVIMVCTHPLHPCQTSIQASNQHSSCCVPDLLCVASRC